MDLLAPWSLFLSRRRRDRVRPRAPQTLDERNVLVSARCVAVLRELRPEAACMAARDRGYRDGPHRGPRAHGIRRRSYDQRRATRTKRGTQGKRAFYSGADDPGGHGTRFVDRRPGCDRRASAAPTWFADDRRPRRCDDRRAPGGAVPSPSNPAHGGAERRPAAARVDWLGGALAADARDSRLALCTGRRGYPGRRDRPTRRTGTFAVFCGDRLRRGDGSLHDRHGERFCRVPHHDGRDRVAVARRAHGRPSGTALCDRNAQWILRDARHPDGSELQPRSTRAARDARPVRADQGADTDGSGAAGRQHRFHADLSVPMTLTDALAPRIAPVLLANLTTRYPYYDAHVFESGDSPHDPFAAHPAFGNSFDWHSSVHSHWTALQLAQRGSAELEYAVTQNLSAENIAAETEYLRRHIGYERPYGWAWAMLLAASAQVSSAVSRPRAAALSAMAAGLGAGALRG